LEIKAVSRISRSQRGAAVVEFSLTLSLFVLIVFGIIEFSTLMMSVSRANEVTRELARIAIVNDPLCDIFVGGCAGGTSSMVCPGGAAVQLTLAEAGTDCAADPNSTGCRMLTRAQAHMPDIEASQIQVTYACSITGTLDRPQVIPLITVGLVNVTYGLMVADLLGLTESEVPVPAFETSRTGEALFTIRPPL
jgi:hypothetical protein